MKIASAVLALGGLQGAVAHYTFPGISSGGTSCQNWGCVRQTTNFQTNGPITDVSSPQMSCYELNPGRGPTGVLSVSAGSTVTFSSAPNIFHPGPAIAYLAKVPSGQSVSTWSPSGAVWFKVWQEAATVTSGGISWSSNNAASVSFPLPRCLENGDYLVRFEHIALHSATNAGGAQLYLSCGQIRVTGGTGGYRTAGLLSFPGSYNANDPGLKVNIYWPVPTNYQPPGGGVGSC